MQLTSTIDNLRPSYIRTILQAATAPGMISLAGGLPAEQNFPLQAMREAAEQVLQDASSLQYANTSGEPELRQWVAEHLQSEPTAILITNGAQQALDLIARALLNPGDSVVMEAPSYLGALQVFEIARAKLLTVDQLTQGPDLEQLETLFRSQRPTLFYAIPDFHNPTGCCWSLQVRQAVVALAEKYQVLIVEDAPYRQLRYSGTSLPSLLELAPHQVCHLGSFSKIAAPGLRLGYLCANPEIIAGTTRVKQATDLHSSTLGQRLLLACLQHPSHAQHLDNTTTLYRQRRDVLAQALEQTLNGQLRFELPEGGMFLWATTQAYDTDVLAQQTLAANVAIVPGSAFFASANSIESPPRQGGRNSMRLNFSHGSPEQLREAVRRIGSVLNF